MTDRLQTQLCDLLGCRYPIIQAGMGGVARAELAAAVSAAGGFGCLGMVRESPETIAREVTALRARTDKPFAVNLIPSSTDPKLFAEEFAACKDLGVKAMIYFWDVVPAAVAEAKAAGMQVLYQVGSVEQARLAADAGADAIIAQGLEAGGHVHGSVSSLVLLPLVARALSLPVVASGGFASGAGLVAALALGAQGIHCGTAFLATQESFAHDLHKDRILEAGAEDTIRTDAYAINWPKGSPVRVLANGMTRALEDNLFGHDPATIERVQVGEEEGRPLYLWSTDSPLRSMTGDLDRLALFAGQVAGQIESIEPAGARIDAIMAEANGILTKLAPKAV